MPSNAYPRVHDGAEAAGEEGDALARLQPLGPVHAALRGGLKGGGVGFVGEGVNGWGGIGVAA